MSKWEKLTVVQLKDELRNRDISLAGLKLKKDFIEKLEAADSTSDNNAPGRIEDALGEVHVESRENLPRPAAKDQTSEQLEGVLTTDLTQTNPDISSDDDLPSKRPPAPTVEDSGASIAKEDARMSFAATDSHATAIQQDGDANTDTPQSSPIQLQKINGSAHISNPVDAVVGHITTAPTEVLSASPDGSDKHLQTPDTHLKRKRSVSDTTDKAQKMFKADDGRIPALQDEASVAREQLSSPHHHEFPLPKGPGSPHFNEGELQEDGVEPARHRSTSALYMCNFKRPINQQELKAHVIAIANGAVAAMDAGGPVKLFYMDKIRSHAFISFQSVTHAAKVRNAMHGKKFPAEPQRDPIWVDFIPDDRVEEFIDRESQSQNNFQSGGRSSSTSLRFEVIYRTTNDGIEAVLQEAGPAGRTSRPSVFAADSDRASFSRKQGSFSADAARTMIATSNLRSHRGDLVVRSPDQWSQREHASYPPRQEAHRQIAAEASDQGTGFQALDDLFSLTTTKPKLYFKLPAQAVVDDRLAMIRALTPARGNSGDPGMKRYTFQQFRGREEWVDDGPEFGRGWRGQDRLKGRKAWRERDRDGDRDSSFASRSWQNTGGSVDYG